MFHIPSVFIRVVLAERTQNPSILITFQKLSFMSNSLRANVSFKEVWPFLLVFGKVLLRVWHRATSQ